MPFNNITESNQAAVNTSRLIAPAPTLNKEHSKVGGRSRASDSIATGTSNKKKGIVSFGARPALPMAKPQPTDYMAILAAAFEKALSSMDQGVKQEVKDYSDLQILDLSMSTEILDSTTLAIKKEQAIYKIQNEIADMEGIESDVGSYLGYGLLALGGLMIFATIVSAFFTGGATAALLPEELAGEEALAGGTELVDLTSEIVPEVVEDEASSVSEAPQAIEASSDTLRKLGTILVKTILAGLFASPMAINGVMSCQISVKLRDLATAQKEVGIAVAGMQKNNIYFQFYQQLVRRESSNLNEEVSNIGEIVKTYGALTNTEQRISAALAQAVVV